MMWLFGTNRLTTEERNRAIADGVTYLTMVCTPWLQDMIQSTPEEEAITEAAVKEWRDRKIICTPYGNSCESENPALGDALESTVFPSYIMDVDGKYGDHIRDQIPRVLELFDGVYLDRIDMLAYTESKYGVKAKEYLSGILGMCREKGKILVLNNIPDSSWTRFGDVICNDYGIRGDDSIGWAKYPESLTMPTMYAALEYTRSMVGKPFYSTFWIHETVWEETKKELFRTEWERACRTLNIYPEYGQFKRPFFPLGHNEDGYSWSEFLDELLLLLQQLIEKVKKEL